jgi:putative MATE family efflux protein
LKDLTTGKPSKVIFNFSLPLLLSTALQQVYNIADSIIVGQFSGSDGLAAIGAAYPITLFFIAIATGSSMGCSVIISQLFGAKNTRDMKSAIYTAIISLITLGVVIAGIGVGISGMLMHLLNAPESIFDNAKAYLMIYSVGVLPMFVYNTSNAIFTGLGDSKRPLYFLLMSSVLNVILDIIAVGPLKMGVAGAAWATTISQLVAAVLSTALLIKRISAIHTDEKVSVFDVKLLKSMSKIAVPSIFQQACVALAHTVVQSLVNTFSNSVIAGYEAASKIHNFCYMSFNTIGTALSSYAAQNFGAGEKKRIKDGLISSTTMCFIFTVIVVAILQLIPKQLIGLFVSGDMNDEMIQAGVKFLRIISPDYLLICFVITAGGLMRGLGKIKDFFIVTVIDFFVRVSMCFILTDALNSYTGLYWAWYFGTVVDLIMCVFILRNMFRKGYLKE